MSILSKIVICGSREFNDYDHFSRHMDEYFSSTDLSRIEIVTGGAKGTDALTERYARERNIKFTKFTSDFEQYGRTAGYVVNAEIAQYCSGPMNTCIVWWNGRSLLAKNMMKEALKTRMSIVKVLIK